MASGKWQIKVKQRIPCMAYKENKEFFVWEVKKTKNSLHKK